MTKRGFHGLRIGGLTLLSSHWYEVGGRRVKFASWHNPRRLCWLWFVEAHLVTASERRAFRVFRLGDSQRRYILQLWRLSIEFVWQADGRNAALARV